MTHSRQPLPTCNRHPTSVRPKEKPDPSQLFTINQFRRYDSPQAIEIADIPIDSLQTLIRNHTQSPLFVEKFPEFFFSVKRLFEFSSDWVLITAKFNYIDFVVQIEREESFHLRHLLHSVCDKSDSVRVASWLGSGNSSRTNTNSTFATLALSLPLPLPLIRTIRTCASRVRCLRDEMAFFEMCGILCSREFSSNE